MRNTWVIIIILLLIGLLVYVLTNAVIRRQPATTPAPTTEPIDNNNDLINRSYNVSIDNFSYVPSTLTINRGDSVIWQNNDSADHTVTSDMTNFDSGTLNSGESFTYMFNEAGYFPYHCSLHPNMRGTITVQ